ncbi:50S ribosomal protein P1 [Candidatus Marsarchaeota archaeon]|nr:50S ribosomal protein P1 [Candidatus Marsarchaeota archaeon]MCL5099625.1 50S ribosomal protein P1 [Candidatus Marsarchaeota archaeon]
MEYVYAALLLDAAGKSVTEKDLMEVVKAAGFSPDEARAKAMVESLKGVDIKDVIKRAQSAPVQSAPTAAAAAPAAAHEAKKKEPAEEKKSDEEAAGGLASLFG